MEPVSTADDAVTNEDELLESVPYLLVDDLIRSRKITMSEGDFLRKKYSTIYGILKQYQAIELSTSKKIRVISNESLSEKINLERCRTVELERCRHVKRLEEERDSELLDFEITAHKDTATRFDLTELKKLHEELFEQLEDVTNDNKNLVEPVLERLRSDIVAIGDMQEESDTAFLKEESEKITLLERMKQLEELLHMKKEIFNDAQVASKASQHQPIRLIKTTENIRMAIKHMEDELSVLEHTTKRKDADIDKRFRKKEEASKLRTHLEEQVELHRQTLEQRESEIAILKKKVETEQAAHHDLVTEKVSLNIKKREVESALRYRDDQLNFLQREYEGHKRLYKKKLNIVDMLRLSIPDLEAQLQNAEATMQTYRREFEEREKRSVDLKDDITSGLGSLLVQEGVEKESKRELEEAMLAVEDLEADILRLLAEDRRLTKLKALLSAQRDASTAEVHRMVVKEKEARQLIRMKELIIIDHTKRCCELSNRHKEFSSLYEIVKNERNKFSNTIMSSSQALAEMREKIRLLEKEIAILQGESNGKTAALLKEKSSYQLAKSQRDKLRKETNDYLADYRTKQRQIELQIQEIDKENTFLNSLEKDMIGVKQSYDKAVAERNAAGVQLINRNDEICVVQERWRQHKEALERGEEALRRKEEELRMLRLQSDELRRSYRVATSQVPEVSRLQTKLQTLEEQLVDERGVISEYGERLEDPQNVDRWRPLEGDDMGLDQLSEKVAGIEKRLDVKRDQLLQRGLVLEEITGLTEKLRIQALKRRNAAGNMADQLSDLQGRIRDATKKMLASVSELSMYQATALRLQEEKVSRTHELEDVRYRVQQGEPPTDDAMRELARSERRRLQMAETSTRRQTELKMNSPLDLKKSTAEPRPTAYIPDEVGLPKPYGSLAPFKPSESSTMTKHIRQPQPKLIEI